MAGAIRGVVHVGGGVHLPAARRALLITAASVIHFTFALGSPRGSAAASVVRAFGGDGEGAWDSIGGSQGGGDPSSCAPVGREGMSSVNPAGEGKTMGGSTDEGGSASSILETYPGTALTRMETCRERAASLTEAQLSGDWEEVRSLLLWAAGLRDLRDVAPGAGNTGHCFNDFNHVDATTMTLDVSDNENRGQVEGIAFGNRLGPGIRVASLPDAGPGGSWCTCAQGGAAEPPQDVAHLQFRSAIAWKLVWVPAGGYARFVLVDDAGERLATGVPTGAVPPMRERQYNYAIVRGGRYARAADAYAAEL